MTIAMCHTYPLSSSSQENHPPDASGKLYKMEATLFNKTVVTLYNDTPSAIAITYLLTIVCISEFSVLAPA